MRYLEDGQWKTPPGGEQIGPAYALTSDAEGTVWVGAWNGLFRATTEQVRATEICGTPIAAVCLQRDANGAAESLFAGGPHGIWRSESGAWTRIEGAWNAAVRALLPAADNRLWIGTASGLYLQDLAAPRSASSRYSRPDVLLSSNINALSRLPDGTMVIASTGGLDFYRGTKRVRALTGRDGMPNHQARAAAQDADGRLWVATKLGVARFDQGRWCLRHSRRWLLSTGP